MSRSRRKTPKIGITTAETDKPFKTREHRRERRLKQSVLSSTLDADHRRMHTAPYGDPWRGDKDGKRYVRDADRKVTAK